MWALTKEREGFGADLGFFRVGLLPSEDPFDPVHP